VTITSISQSFSLTSVRLNVSARPVTTSAPDLARASKAEPDRITLSPEATAPAKGAAARRPEGTEVPVTQVNPVTRAERRANALFGALDADEDGAITEQEFTEGAAALLRRAGERRRARRGDGDDDDNRSARSEERAARRLERKLERAFARVDANDDGSIDKEELTSALAQARAPRSGGPPPSSDAPPPTVSFSFTYVSIAVQRYTSLQTPDANGQKQAA
jgi:EF hand